MAMRLAALMSLLVASAKECPRAAWMLSLKTQSGEDLCLDAASEGALVFHACHGGPNQQWYQQGELIHNSQYSGCLTRAIASSQFLLSHCGHGNLLQHFTVTNKNESLVIWQDSFCLTLGWEGQTALPFARSCSMHSDRQKHGETLTKTALTCIERRTISGTLDKPLLEGGLDAWWVLDVLAIVMLIMVSVAGLLVALFWDSRTIRMLVLSAVPPETIKTMEEGLAELRKKIKTCRLELFKEMEASRLDQSKLETRIDQGLLDQLAALKSSVDQLGNLPALMATMETKISSSVCEMDSCAASISAVTNSFGWSIQSVAEQLTELTKEMNESREDQSKLEMKIGQFLVDHITACKSQVGQLKQLVSRGYMETYETSDTSSSAGSLDSWIRIPGGEPCCYLPETHFQVRTADGDEILSPATKLIEGSQVKADDGTWVQVASPPEQHHRPVIKLQADQSFLVVSEDHRIVVRGNQTVLAKELSKDEQVMLDGKTKARLTFVERLKPTMVLKISFRPDLAVRAFMVPPTILSKGSRKRNFRRGNHQGEEGLVGSDPESEMPNTYRSY